MADVHVGDTGTMFKLTVRDQDGNIVPLNGATLLQVKFLKPDASVATKAASLLTDGTDGIVMYVTSANDIDQSGRWQLQAVVAKNGGQWSSDVIKFKVFANLG